MRHSNATENSQSLRQITLLSYNKKEFKEEQSDDIDYMLECGKERPGYIHWVQVKGIGDAELVKKIGASLGLNSLVLEDITDTTQRPKYDEYEDFLRSRNISNTSSWISIPNPKRRISPKPSASGICSSRCTARPARKGIR
ncbi:MAG TPA: hypothetical protein VGM89_09805 [Puia sp.]